MNNLKSLFAPGAWKRFTMGFFLAIVVVFVFQILGSQAALADVIYVDDDASGGGDGSLEAPFQAIQDAVNDSEAGDTLRVFEGRYRESVLIETPLTLEGNGTTETIIDVEGREENGILVSASWVNISGLAVTGSLNTDYSPETNTGAIRITGDHVSVSGCNISENPGLGIMVYESNFTKLENLFLEGNSRENIYFYDVGNCSLENSVVRDAERCAVTIERSYLCLVEGNLIRSILKQEGIVLRASSLCQLSNNSCFETGKEGIVLEQGSSGNFLFNNICQESEDGLRVWSDCSLNLISGCTFSENEKSGIILAGRENVVKDTNCSFNGDYGMELLNSSGTELRRVTSCFNKYDGFETDKEVIDSYISDCNFSDNRNGIFLRGHGNVITGSTFSSNRENGIRLSHPRNSIEDNTICLNGEDGVFAWPHADSCFFIKNRCFLNQGRGLVISGKDHILSANTVYSAGQVGGKRSYPCR